MMKNATRIAMAAAAASMAVMPIAAQANTRAGDSGAVYSATASQPGLARSTNGEAFKDASSIFLALLASAAIIGGIIFATQSDDNGQSPGT